MPKRGQNDGRGVDQRAVQVEKNRAEAHRS
jgi:hypothetical protein